MNDVDTRSDELPDLDPGSTPAEETREAQDSLDALREQISRLEARNRELSSGHAELSDALNRYTKLYDVAPVAYVTIDRKGTILEANRTAAAMLGIERGVLKHRKKLTHFIARDGRSEWLKYLRVLFNDRHEQGGPDENHRYFESSHRIELPIDIENNPVAYVQIDTIALNRVQIEAPRGLVALIDITRRRQYEKAIQESQAILSSELAAITLLHEVSIHCMVENELQPLLNKITTAAVDVAGADMGALLVIAQDAHMPDLIAHHGFKKRHIQPMTAASITMTAAWRDRLEHGERVVVEDLTDDILSDAPASLDALHAAGVHSMQSTPLLHSSGQLLGVLSTCWRSKHCPPHRILRQIDLLGRQAANSIERARSKAAIIHAKKEWETTFDSMPDLIALLDDNHRILRVNRSMADRLNLEPKDCIGKLCCKLVHGTDVPPEYCPHRHSLADGKEHRAELIEPDLGSFEVSVTPLYNEEGKHIASVHVARDITALKVAQHREQEAAALMAASRTAVDILETMGEGVLFMDMTGKVLTVNAALARMTGRPSYELVGQEANALFPRLFAAEDLHITIAALTTAIDGNTPSLPPVSLLTAEGSRIPVTLSIAFVRDADQKPTAIVATLQDISPIRSAQASLQESERKYRELVQNANSIIMRITPDHTITFFNEYAQKFFGYSGDEIIGRNVLGTIVPELESSGRDLRKLLHDITDDPDLHAANENENTCKDGKRVWVHWANRAVYDGEGNIIEILCVGTDITTRKKMEEEMRRYQQRLRSLARQLAATGDAERWQISQYIHDTIVQNLSLASIRLASTAARLEDSPHADEVKTLESTRQFIDDAVSECRAVMSELTPSLLYDLGLVPALADLASRIQERNDVRVHVSSDKADVEMEHTLRGVLFQSTRELVMNALKHAGQTDIDVSLTHSGDSLAVHVADTGCGFDTSVLGRNGTTHNGFGLFSIRERLEDLGGVLDIESAPGEGTTARISMPLGPR